MSSKQNATVDQLHLGMSELRDCMFAYNDQANILHIQTTASALAESSKQNATLDQLHLGMSELREFMFTYNHHDQANFLHIQTTASALEERTSLQSRTQPSTSCILVCRN